MRHPVAVAVPVTAGLLLLGAPFLGVKLGSPWATVLPEDAESRVGWEIVARQFGPGELAQVIAVTTSDTSVLSPENIAATHEYVQRMQADPRVRRVDSILVCRPGCNIGAVPIPVLSATTGGHRRATGGTRVG